MSDYIVTHSFTCEGNNNMIKVSKTTASIYVRYGKATGLMRTIQCPPDLHMANQLFRMCTPGWFDGISTDCVTYDHALHAAELETLAEIVCEEFMGSPDTGKKMDALVARFIKT